MLVVRLVVLAAQLRRKRCRKRRRRPNYRPPRQSISNFAPAKSSSDQHQLDDVDLSRKVRGNLEADFLLTDGGLGPDLHGNSSKAARCHFLTCVWAPRRGSPPTAARDRSITRSALALITTRPFLLQVKCSHEFVWLSGLKSPSETAIVGSRGGCRMAFMPSMARDRDDFRHDRA